MINIYIYIFFLRSGAIKKTSGAEAPNAQRRAWFTQNLYDFLCFVEHKRRIVVTRQLMDPIDFQFFFILWIPMDPSTVWLPIFFKNIVLCVQQNKETEQICPGLCISHNN